MPNCFQLFQSRVPGSSSAHRNSQRANATLQLVSGLVQDASNSTNPALFLPLSFAQMLVSANQVRNSEIFSAERCIHLLQASLSAGETILAIILLAMYEVCNNDYSNLNLCRALYIIRLLYQSTLLVTWVPSEVSKAPEAAASTPAATATATAVTAPTQIHEEIDEPHEPSLTV